MKHLLQVATLLFMVLPGSAAADVEQEKKSPSQVWLFVATDCPIANSYAPEINRLYKAFASKSLEFSLIYPEATLREEEVSEHREAYALLPSAEIDRDHRYVKKAGVTTTPEVAVFDSGGNLIYRGMIDDLYTEFGDRKRKASRRFLRDVLEKLSASEEVSFYETKPVGCLIESIK